MEAGVGAILGYIIGRTLDGREVKIAVTPVEPIEDFDVFYFTTTIASGQKKEIAKIETETSKKTRILYIGHCWHSNTVWTLDTKGRASIQWQTQLGTPASLFWLNYQVPEESKVLIQNNDSSPHDYTVVLVTSKAYRKVTGLNDASLCTQTLPSSVAGRTDYIPVLEVAPCTVRYQASPGDLAEGEWASALGDIKGRPNIVLTHWGGTALTGRDVSLDFQALATSLECNNIRNTRGFSVVKQITPVTSGSTAYLRILNPNASGKTVIVYKIIMSNNASASPYGNVGWIFSVMRDVADASGSTSVTPNTLDVGSGASPVVTSTFKNADPGWDASKVLLYGSNTLTTVFDVFIKLRANQSLTLRCANISGANSDLWPSIFWWEE